MWHLKEVCIRTFANTGSKCPMNGELFLLLLMCKVLTDALILLIKREQN